jgi:hypothetical protein
MANKKIRGQGPKSGGNNKMKLFKQNYCIGFTHEYKIIKRNIYTDGKKYFAKYKGQFKKVVFDKSLGWWFFSRIKA